MTNREKFKEVFGFDIRTDRDDCFADECCEDCPGISSKYFNCSEFWDDEYQSPKSKEDK